MNNLPISKKSALVIGVIAFLLLCFIFLGFSNERIDYLPNDAVDADYSNQVNLISEENIVALLGGVQHKQMLAEDLYVFAKTGYATYTTNPPEAIGFKLSSIKTVDNKIELEGRFGATKNKIIASILPLQHGMIASSITDTESGLNIDKSLPSNSVRNQFIGSLPLETSEYVIDYVPDTDGFSVNIFNSSQNQEKAQEALKTGLGITTLALENIVYYGVGTTGYNNDY